MKNYSSSEREINTGNIFAINRLGLDNTLEERSIFNGRNRLQKRRAKRNKQIF